MNNVETIQSKCCNTGKTPEQEGANLAQVVQSLRYGAGAIETIRSEHEKRFCSSCRSEFRTAFFNKMEVQ